MTEDIVIQCCGGKILWVATHNLILIFRSVRQEDEVMHHINQSFLAELPVHHGKHRVESSFKHRVSCFRFVPAIEIFVWSKKRTHLIVHTIADDHECVIAEQFGNITTIAASELLVGVLNGRILLDSVLKLQDNNR